MFFFFRLNLQKHFEFLQQILSSFREKTQQFLNVTRNLERKWHLRPICGLRRERRFMLLMTLSSTLFFTLKPKSISFFVEPAWNKCVTVYPWQTKKVYETFKRQGNTITHVPWFRIIWGGSQWTFMQIVFFSPYIWYKANDMKTEKLILQL